ncbi:immunoglobulin G-binding protein H [Drosophila biarmipes]|uniref:immunoglobulin G-binding protein H n=1 Tax=Drosophila biarmipes TaxID=125945 RepID=UPI0007E822E0|nr:immunoglobulin G-binding protein H [Drosophila biarmipes]
MAVSAEIERLLDQGNYLMPDLNMSQSDLANPTEPIVTKIMVHYLRCFAFRVEPPYKIGSELAQSSREARVFLIRVCRQVERIIQISFPNKTYTYVDIIKPAVKKTLATLSYLFNYLAYYKMFKKSVLGPVEEAIMLKDSLAAELKAKSQQLEQRKLKTKECEAAIGQLKNELQDTQAKLLPLKKSCSEQASALELIEQQQNELDMRITHWEQLVVKDGQVAELQKNIKSANSHVESCKAELASKKQVINEHRRVIEASQQAVTALEEATAVLPLTKLEEYKKSSKDLEAAEEKRAALEANYQKRCQDLEARKQELSLTEQQCEAAKHRHEAEHQKQQQELEKLKVDLEERKKQIKLLNSSIVELEQQNVEKEQLHAILMEQLTEIFGENWQLNST